MRTAYLGTLAGTLAAAALTESPALAVEAEPARHARLTAGADVSQAGIRAANAAFRAGGSPRAQIDAARAATGQALVYKPHIGARQRERELRRMAKAAKP